ncbi:MAG: DegT/DnrJ/EryC1/StrS aminotransferase family protein [Mitsuaria chitosanitabida]|uniref:DegT/DnrJ/EryC1/StrS family aminotransferase n=1 Tax=Roseateles chitosanitabidus TaxID=65048 RepID=UPI001B2C6271|nr:DegT/DnrJ/EryC1/StrS aminotransferase family protein [Roseateles chitosanitabidus]MBO9687893.1 DegT/DnrJ/EryC1/StrS aminotransferase family protein [Roseateles chitosanitabidus]
MTEPFLPFTRPDIDEATIAAVGEVLRSGWITTGPKSQAFEARLSEFFGGRPVRCFSNGTATLEVALRVAGIGPGDEVITTPLTWVATANVIVAVGAAPVFVDVDPVTRNLDLDAVEAAITPRTRAVIPVHLTGLPVDMDRLYAIAKRHALRIVEDAAQAIDSRWIGAGDTGEGRRIGAFGDLVSFSFQANKNLTCAEGGCLVLNTPEEARHAERLRLQGIVRSGFDGLEMSEPGGKSNLSDVHAVIGLGQMDRLPAITARRAVLAQRYLDRLKASGIEALGVELPPALATTGAITNWHMFQVVLPADRIDGGRAAVMSLLKDAGIGAGVHYPAVHLLDFYRRRGWREGQLPVAERIGRGTLTLPLFPAMSDEDVDRVCQQLERACRLLLT